VVNPLAKVVDKVNSLSQIASAVERATGDYYLPYLHFPLQS